MKFDIDRTEYLTMNVLKDFQRATVERIDTLFRKGQGRILVADEVGMGKTLIARGVIVKTARLRLDEGDDLFKVVYICSNISIANQNIRKLKVSDSATIEGVSDTRLSMQHLKITQQELDPDLRDGYIQLIPLTPDTSFRMTTGGGTVNERALMYAVLRRMPEFADVLSELKSFLKYSVSKEDSWNYYIDLYEGHVKSCEDRTQGRYPYDLIERIWEYDRENSTSTLLKQHLQERMTQQHPSHNGTFVLNKLRVMFARLSTQMLEPDLVIMDEFQRFRFLINSDRESDTGILAHQFLEGGNVRILLLSATPYKLYSTLEEIDDAAGVDEHYREFLQVMDFLFKGNTKDFRKVWTNYNVALHELHDGDTTIIQVKDAAEDAMYQGVCRTERISVMESGDYTDDSSVKCPIPVSEEDIRSFLAMGTLLKEIGAPFSLPVDYAKSSPFLMSFMRNYKVKQHVERYFQKHIEDVKLAEKDLLWVDPEQVNAYRPLPASNARLEKLKGLAFENHAEMYLWVPPSRPYYELQGVYRNSNHFSKILVFSAWEMVPRMIGAMISYEAECRTVGRVCENAEGIEEKNRTYNAERRYPYPRLKFSLSGNTPQRMTLFCLLYPSATLADLFDPIQVLNADLTLEEIENGIRSQMITHLRKLRRFATADMRTADARWYYLAPMLMDGIEYTENWIGALNSSMENASEDGEDGISSDRGNKAFSMHVSRLLEWISQGDNLSLGPMPEDLMETLVNMTLGSPAVCIYRSNRKNVIYATALAKTFLNYFNTTESTAVIQLAAEQHRAESQDDTVYWKDVLLYCKNGCFQAMFDEYRHLISDAAGFSTALQKEARIQRTMLEDLRIHTASYDVDTFAKFQNRIQGGKGRNLMRAHYAVGFVNNEGADNQKDANRKDSIRGAFNSPLKPFILATTSIGQEGLDFHNYCRRIMHWNLPGNPIDLEQREGRINRFKCLAIRQNVAEKYGSTRFYDDIWKEMFEAAESEKAPSQSDLVPYWCFGKDQSIKIERIVPMYPMSKDEITYERMEKILLLYRLTLGQARQEELLEYLFHEYKNPEELKKLFIDLSPFSKEGYAERRQHDNNHRDEDAVKHDLAKANKLSGKDILINRAIEAYIKNTDHSNYCDDNSLIYETLKWAAASTFAQNWDQDAEDMLSMWKECTKRACIDNLHNHPSQGITVLLKNSSEVEGVRSAFKSLFVKDLDDVEEKWKRVQAFLEYINGRLANLYPDSTSYLQTKEAVLTYLNLWDPDHNYRYKPAPANHWASYIGNIDWESSQRFSLHKYYKMCDEIQEVVKNHSELLHIHSRRFKNGEVDYDKELHILTFDVLYYFWNYEEAMRESVEEYQEAIRQQQIDEMEEQLSTICAEIKVKEGLIRDPNCLGIIVHHTFYGVGIITSVNNGKLDIDFKSVGTKQFLFPSSIENGFLQPEDSSIMEQFRINRTLEKEISLLRERAEQLMAKLAEEDK